MKPPYSNKYVLGPNKNKYWNSISGGMIIETNHIY